MEMYKCRAEANYKLANNILVASQVKAIDSQQLSKRFSTQYWRLITATD